jgi:hypothetical protein
MFSGDIKKMSNDYLVLFVFCKYLPISCLHSMVQCSPGQAVIVKHNACRIGISVPRLRRSLDQWEMKTPSFGQDEEAVMNEHEGFLAVLYLSHLEYVSASSLKSV